MFVIARDGEPFEELYRRFKRGIEGSGLLREYRRKQRFEPNHELRRRKIQQAARTARKKNRRGER
jgi:ribosomal protein S21